MARSTENHSHGGHRERMRERFLTAGGNALADHELLETVLFYTIPRRDTNELAHRLLESFGSLANVLEADVDLLARFDGLGESSATYLKLLHELTRRYTADKFNANDKKIVFDTPGKIAAFMAPRYMGVNIERVYLLMFDNGMHMLDCFHVCDGSVAGVSLSMRRIAERAYQKGAAAVILTHNHPGGSATPSTDDVRVTRRLEESLRLLEIPLLEHYVFADRSYAPIMSFSLDQREEAYAASSLFDMLRQSLQKMKEDSENERKQDES